jgi:hypothetical protein
MAYEVKVKLPLCLIKYHVIEPYPSNVSPWRRISALAEGELSAPRPSRFTPGESLVPVG